MSKKTRINAKTIVTEIETETEMETETETATSVTTKNKPKPKPRTTRTKKIITNKKDTLDANAIVDNGNAKRCGELLAEALTFIKGSKYRRNLQPLCNAIIDLGGLAHKFKLSDITKIITFIIDIHDLISTFDTDNYLKQTLHILCKNCTKEQMLTIIRNEEEKYKIKYNCSEGNLLSVKQFVKYYLADNNLIDLDDYSLIRKCLNFKYDNKRIGGSLCIEGYATKILSFNNNNNIKLDCLLFLGSEYHIIKFINDTAFDITSLSNSFEKYVLLYFNENHVRYNFVEILKILLSKNIIIDTKTFYNLWFIFYQITKRFFSIDLNSRYDATTSAKDFIKIVIINKEKYGFGWFLGSNNQESNGLPKKYVSYDKIVPMFIKLGFYDNEWYLQMISNYLFSGEPNLILIKIMDKIILLICFVHYITNNNNNDKDINISNDIDMSNDINNNNNDNDTNKKKLRHADQALKNFLFYIKFMHDFTYSAETFQLLQRYVVKYDLSYIIPTNKDYIVDITSDTYAIPLSYNIMDIIEKYYNIDNNILCILCEYGYIAETQHIVKKYKIYPTNDHLNKFSKWYPYHKSIINNNIIYYNIFRLSNSTNSKSKINAIMSKSHYYGSLKYNLDAISNKIGEMTFTKDKVKNFDFANTELLKEITIDEDEYLKMLKYLLSFKLQPNSGTIYNMLNFDACNDDTIQKLNPNDNEQHYECGKYLEIIYNDYYNKNVKRRNTNLANDDNRYYEYMSDTLIKTLGLGNDSSINDNDNINNDDVINDSDDDNDNDNDNDSDSNSNTNNRKTKNSATLTKAIKLVKPESEAKTEPTTELETDIMLNANQKSIFDDCHKLLNYIYKNGIYDICVKNPVYDKKIFNFMHNSELFCSVIRLLKNNNIVIDKPTIKKLLALPFIDKDVLANLLLSLDDYDEELYFEAYINETLVFYKHLFTKPKFILRNMCFSNSYKAKEIIEYMKKHKLKLDKYCYIFAFNNKNQIHKYLLDEKCDVPIQCLYMNTYNALIFNRHTSTNKLSLMMANIALEKHNTIEYLTQEYDVSF